MVTFLIITALFVLACVIALQVIDARDERARRSRIA